MIGPGGNEDPTVPTMEGLWFSGGPLTRHGELVGVLEKLLDTNCTTSARSS